MHKRSILTFSFFFVFLFAQTVFAGLPFISDDPATVPYGQWEFYLYSNMDRMSHTTYADGPATEADIGAGRHLELHLVVSNSFYLPQQGARTAGFSDIETGIKYRFFDESARHPAIAFAPMFELPTGNANRNLGNGRFWLILPLWLEKTWGRWSSYGGGGYAINPAPTMRNYAFAGWVVQRKLGAKLVLGSEIFSQGAMSTNIQALTILDAGGYYYLQKNFGILFSAGQSIFGQRHAVGSLGLFWTG